MLTPGYSLTASERVLPSMALDFTAAVTDARVDTARANNTATRINPSGAIEIVNANLPRYDFDPVTLVCKGQLIEVGRTNLLLNSLIDGTDLATQSVTLSAVAYTLSFYGSGSVAVSGGHSATVDGAGDYPNRKTYTFTPSAGSTTFTVTGAVKYAQLEAGSFSTSFIPTAGTAVARASDAVSMTGTNFSNWYTATAGTIVVDSAPINEPGVYLFSLCGAGNTGNDALYSYISTNYLVQCFTGGALQANINTGVVGGTAVRVVAAYASNNFAAAANAGTIGLDATYTQPTADKLRIGAAPNNTIFGAQHVRKLFFYPQRLINAEVQAFSK